MTSTKVATTTTGKGQEKREMRPAANLQEGDWLAAGTIDDEFGDTVTEPTEVLSVHAKNDAVYGPAHLVVVRKLDGDQVTQTFTPAADALPLATRAELDEVKEDVRRQVTAAQLRQLANLIVDRKVPLPKYALNVHTHSVKNMDDLKAIADALGVPVEHSYGNRYEVVWPAGHLSFHDGVHMEWSATKPEDPKPEPEQEMVAAREADNGDPGARVPAGVTGFNPGGPVARVAATPNSRAA